MEKYVRARQAVDDNIIRRMRIECWMLQTYSEYNDSFFYQLDAQILCFNTFITFLYMFRALLCSSSGGLLHLLHS